MANLIGNKYLDLYDLYQNQGTKNGGVPAVIDMLSQTNPILQDATAIECNDGKRHKYSVLTGLPESYWGEYYTGVPTSKGNMVQATDVTGFIESMSMVDSRLIDGQPNQATIRLNQSKNHIESINQAVCQSLFYGNNIADSKQFNGLSARFHDTNAGNGNQIIDAGGSSNKNTSIWFMTWASHLTSLIYPQGSMAGVQRKDRGEQPQVDSVGNRYYGYEETFTWNVGLSVPDWRYVVRIKNIDVDALMNNTSNIYDLMRKAYYRHWGRRTKMGNTVIYCNRDVMEALDANASNAGLVNDNYIRLKPGHDIQGMEIMTYRGIPIREVDALLSTEANA